MGRFDKRIDQAILSAAVMPYNMEDTAKPLIAVTMRT